MARYYRYYDSPDGYDLFHKTQYICRKAAAVGATIALTDVLCITQPKTYFGMVERGVRLFFPPIIAGALFTSTVYAATNIRKKDDSYNHALGGIIATSYINKLFKNTPLVWILGCPLILTIVMYKDMKMLDNVQFEPDPTDNLMNIGGLAIEYDLKRDSIVKNKDSWVNASWFN